MAKAFKEYTIEDLYRLNFSFLIQSIKDKELEDASVSEEGFIKAQKLALMNIFAITDSQGIDAGKQSIEPFLVGRRLESDLTKIQSIAEGIKASVAVVKTAPEITFSDSIAKQIAGVKLKIGQRDYMKEILNIRSQTSNLLNQVATYDAEILKISRKISEYNKEISSLTLLHANAELNNSTEPNRLIEFLSLLIKNGWHIGYVYEQSSSGEIKVCAMRSCKMQFKHPDRQSVMLNAHIPVFVNFFLTNSGISFNLNKDAMRYSVSSAAYGNYHPHISDSGSFCLGNTASMFSNITSKGTYPLIADFVSVITSLVDTYNPSSPYVTIAEAYFCNVNFILNWRYRSSSSVGRNFVAFMQSPEIKQRLHSFGEYLRGNCNSAFSSESVVNFYYEHISNLIDDCNQLEFIDVLRNFENGQNINGGQSNYFDDIDEGSCNWDRNCNLFEMLKDIKLNQGVASEIKDKEIEEINF